MLITILVILTSLSLSSTLMLIFSLMLSSMISKKSERETNKPFHPQIYTQDTFPTSG